MMRNCFFESYFLIEMTPSLLYPSFYIPPIIYDVPFHDDLDNTLVEIVVSNTCLFRFVFFDAFDQQYVDDRKTGKTEIVLNKLEVFLDHTEWLQVGIQADELISKAFDENSKLYLS